VRRAHERVERLEGELADARAGLGPRMRAKTLRANPSDPDTRLMPTRNQGFVQGFNAQIAVSDDHVILAADVCQDTTDAASFVPMMAKTLASVEETLGADARIGVVPADAGCLSEEALGAPGPDRLISPGRDMDKTKRGWKNPRIIQMARRLEPGGPDRALYKRRQATVEPVIGQIKDRIGLRRFSRRGLQAAKHELAFAATAYNLLKLATA
jgi:hypothetical protein